MRHAPPIIAALLLVHSATLNLQAGGVSGFTTYGGSWQAQDGVLSVSADAGAKLISDTPAFATGEVGVEMLLPEAGGGNAGLIVKVSEPGVGADRFNGYEVSLDANRQMLRLGRHRQNFELLRDVPCTVPTDQWIALVVRMTDTSIEVVVNNKNILTYDDREHPLAPGSVGFRPWQRRAQFRNFRITTNGQLQAIPFVAAQPVALMTTPLPPIAFLARHPLSAPPAVGQDLWAAQPRALGCSLRIFDGKTTKHIFDDPTGCIYDMNVSYDAKMLLFSYRRQDEKYWHLWRINTDGTGLKQLTDGPYYDVSPCLLPNNEIVFVSTRRFGFTLCQPGPASNLHVMSPDGSNIRCVSMNTLSDFTPQMLPDSRVLFTRWEYIDRDLTYRQSLWTQYPDGTAYQLYFGNTIRDVGSFLQARPLPGCSDKVVATFAPHHGFPHGAIGLIDRNFGPEGPKGKGFIYLTKELDVIADTRQEWAYRDPFPLSDKLFLCSYGGDNNRYRIYLLDLAGNKQLVCDDPTLGCYYPLPLQPTSVPPVIASRIGEGTNGTFLLSDVYRGLEPTIKRGQVKFLRVMEQVRKTEDLKSRAYDESPVMSYGTYYAKRCWGTVPVEADGSAHFIAPALREIYFQVLDTEGRELQRMTSAAQLMPGEKVSCNGCHEPRQSSPVPVVPSAARQPPRQLAGFTGIIDFPTLVQPVLDTHCIKCHQGSKPAGGYDFTGDKTRYFSMAYDNLLGRSRSYRQHDMNTGEMLPAEKAKGKPLVHFFWLLRTPTAINQPLITGCYASRLTDIIESKHCGHALPLEDRQRIYLWIDANVPYYSTYAHSRPLSPGRRDRWTDAQSGQLAPWFAKEFTDAYNRRCLSCHGKIEGTLDWTGRYAWINLSKPQLSSALTAHLSKAAGGRGLDKFLFTTTADPDYQAMLKAIETGKQQMLEVPEADMPGFQHARTEP